MWNSGFFLFFAVNPSIEGPLFFCICAQSLVPGMEAATAFCSSMSGSFHSGIHSVKVSPNPTLFNIPTEKYDFNFIIIFITGFYYCCHHCCYHGNELSCVSTSYLEMGNPSLTFILYLGNTVKTGLKTWKTKRMETSETD